MFQIAHFKYKRTVDYMKRHKSTSRNQGTDAASMNLSKYPTNRNYDIEELIIYYGYRLVDFKIKILI